MSNPVSIEYARAGARRPSLRLLSVAAMIVALGGTGAAVWVTFAELWPIPPGTPIRPMGMALLVFLIAFATFGVATTLAVVGITIGRRDWRSIVLAVVAIALSLAPLLASNCAGDWIAARHALVWEP